MSLKAFLTRLIVTSMLPLLLLAGYFAVDRVRSVQGHYDREAATLSRNVATELDRDLSAQISALQILANSTTLDTPPQFREFYREAQAFRKNFDGHVVLSNRSGQMIITTRVPFDTKLPNIPQVRGHSAVAGVAATGKPAVGDIFIGPLNGARLVAMAVPVSRNGQFSHYLLNVVETNQFQHHLNQLTLPSGWRLTLFDSKGEVIARRGPPAADATPATSAMTGRFIVTSAVAPWRVVLDLPPVLYRTPVREAVVTMVLLLLGATLISVLGGMVASRKLARCVESLTESFPDHTPRRVISEIETVRAVMQQEARTRQNLEVTLLQSEERYRSLVEQTPIAIFVNRNNRIDYANPAALHLFGAADSTDVLGRTPYDFFPASYHAVITERIQTLLSGGNVPLAEFRVRRLDGAERVVEVIAAAFSDRQGPAIQVLIHDVTERNHAVAVLRENEERLRLLGDNLPDSYVYQYYRDPDGTQRFLHLSSGVERLHGVSAAAVLADARVLHRQIDPEQMPALAALETVSQESMSDFSIELRMRREDGQWRWMKVRSRPRGNTDGSVVWDGVATDITDLKQTEDQLEAYRVHLEELVAARTAELTAAIAQIRASEQRYEYALAAANDGIWDWNLASETAYCSPAYFRMLGYEPGELGTQTQKHWIDLLHPEERDTVVATVRQRLEDDGAYEIEFRMRTRDGGYQWILSRGKVVARDDRGRPLRAVGTHTDLTQRKEMEIELRNAKETAEAATRAKSAFLANMSHELRTPLTTILGNCEILGEGILGSLSEKQLKMTTTIESSGRHLLALINDILDLAKVEADREELQIVQGSVEEIVLSSLQFVRHMALNKQITVSHNLVATPKFIMTDQRRIRQILINLLSNAVKFTPPGGLVGLEVVGHPQDGHLSFTVWDTGIGIAAKDQARLFTPFTQVDSSLSRQYNGTGLGLVLVDRLVKLMGGEITMTSVPGQGSRFTVTIPCREAVPEPSAQPASDNVAPDAELPQTETSPLVLVVDDCLSNVQMLAEYLNLRGFRTIIATNGAGAIALAREKHPDVMVMDIQMPGIDGLTAIRTIRGFAPPDNMVPIVAYSALAMAEDRERCLEAGADEYLPKPASQKELAAVIMKLCKNLS